MCRSTPVPTLTCWIEKFTIETDVNDINLSSLLLADCGSSFIIQVFKLFTYSSYKMYLLTRNCEWIYIISGNLLILVALHSYPLNGPPAELHSAVTGAPAAASC
jgi:hypothetical protein